MRSDVIVGLTLAMLFLLGLWCITRKPPDSYIQTRLPHVVWQYRELIRNHTWRALLRRIPRHVRRLIVEHHFRDYTYRDYERGNRPDA